MSNDDEISVKVEFGGGLELLFDNVRSHRISIPSRIPKHWSPPTNSNSHPPQPQPANATDETRPTDINYLIFWLRDHLLKEREELFIENNTVRPGILVLVNDTDWELEGEGDYVLKDGDEIVFISTLHGG